MVTDTAVMKSTVFSLCDLKNKKKQFFFTVTFIPFLNLCGDWTMLNKDSYKWN